MDRRKFIKRAGAAAAGTIIAPYILPSGRLFAASGGSGLAQHVVLVMFAGGVRQQESVLQRYLGDSQGEPYEGNILYNLLDGAPPTQKIVYGTGLAVSTRSRASSVKHSVRRVRSSRKCAP